MAIADHEFKPEFWPTLVMLLVVAGFTTLGFWQLDRLEQKEALIAEVQQRAFNDPVSLPEDLSQLDSIEFTHVRLTGHFLHDKELHFAARAYQLKSGYNILTPFVLEDGRILLVNRGFVPAEKLHPDARPEGQVAGQVTLVGFVRKPMKGNYFTPENSPEKNIWFREDPVQSGAFLNLPLLPVVISLAGDSPNGGFPVPVGGEFRLRNDHLGYAITWFSLALVGAVMYVLFSLRKRDQRA